MSTFLREIPEWQQPWAGEDRKRKEGQMMREAHVEGENLGSRLTEVAVSPACDYAVWNKPNLEQKFSVTSRRTDISMPFTLKDKNTLGPNHSFISQLQREPLITLSGHYQASIMGVTSVQCSHGCSGRPNPHGFESGADGMGRTLQTVTAYNRDYKERDGTMSK